MSRDTKELVKIIIGIIVVVAIIIGIIFFATRTASCQRSCVDIKSNINNGLERTINIYTADGNIIATYKGKIDLDTNDGGYVKFDFEGKRYIYYNCFVESIAIID